MIDPPNAGIPGDESEQADLAERGGLHVRKAGERRTGVELNWRNDVRLFEAKDPTRSKAFATTAKLRDTMQAFGVVNKPDACCLIE